MLIGLCTMVDKFLRLCSVMWDNHRIAVNDELVQMGKKWLLPILRQSSSTWIWTPMWVRFSSHPYWPLGPPSLLHIGHQVPFPGIKSPEHGIYNPPPCSTEVKERVELYPPPPSLSCHHGMIQDEILPRMWMCFKLCLPLICESHVKLSFQSAW
jgi:hypothetical protein